MTWREFRGLRRWSRLIAIQMDELCIGYEKGSPCRSCPDVGVPVVESRFLW